MSASFRDVQPIVHLDQVLAMDEGGYKCKKMFRFEAAGICKLFKLIEWPPSGEFRRGEKGGEHVYNCLQAFLALLARLAHPGTLFDCRELGFTGMPRVSEASNECAKHLSSSIHTH